MDQELKRLIKNIVAALIIGVGIYFLVDYLSKEKAPELEIEDTPLQIQSIKTITEISTISYTDEIVLDTLEMYDDDINYSSLSDWSDIYDRLNNKNIKRRLTLIIKGEIRFGVNLNDENFEITNTADTLFIQLPNPKILDIIINPSETEVYKEKGMWADEARRDLEEKAKIILTKNAENLLLFDKSIENTRNLFQKLLISQKEIVISFE